MDNASLKSATERKGEPLLANPAQTENRRKHYKHARPRTRRAVGDFADFKFSENPNLANLVDLK